MNYRFPLATSSWDEEEIIALHRVIESDRYSMGNEVAEFEEQFSNYLGSKYAVMVNSGSSANLLMTAALFFTNNAALKLKRGDEIIVPAVSWPTTYYPLSQYGLHLKFVDIDHNTLNYDLEALASAVSGNTKAIMVVNLLGNPNDFDQIESIIRGRDIVIIEDNCESLGARFNGKQAGTFGVMGTFSLFFSHHISTMEGGIIATDDEELYHILLTLRAHGWTRNLPTENRVTGTKSTDLFEESFRFVLPGYNVRPIEMSGALGKTQLSKLPELIQGRRKNGELFTTAMEKHPLFRIQKEVGTSSWFGFSLVLRSDSDLDRKKIVKRLNILGFECRPIVGGNFANSEVMKYIDHSVHGELLNAEYIDKFGLFIGNHHYSIEDAIGTLVTLN